MPGGPYRVVFPNEDNSASPDRLLSRLQTTQMQIRKRSPTKGCCFVIHPKTREQMKEKFKVTKRIFQKQTRVKITRHWSCWTWKKRSQEVGQHPLK